MASPIGIGNVGGPEGYKRSTPTPAKREADVNPQVGTDGFSGSIPQQEAPQQQAAITASPASAKPAAAEATTNRNPIHLSMEEGIGAIGLGGNTEAIGLSAFTNGIGKNNITTISGRVLAGNPYGN